jgi:hypothetical protein
MFLADKKKLWWKGMEAMSLPEHVQEWNNYKKSQSGYDNISSNYNIIYKIFVLNANSGEYEQKSVAS